MNLNPEPTKRGLQPEQYSGSIRASTSSWGRESPVAPWRAPRTRRNAYGAGSLILRNAADAVKIPPAHKKEAKLLTPTELTALLSILRSLLSPLD